MFEWKKHGGRSLNQDYWFTKDFCTTHGFDFDAIRRRLRANHGFDDFEVMLNSQFLIPLFDELPIEMRDD